MTEQTKEYYTLKEVVELFEIEEYFLFDLEKEDIICPKCGAEGSEKKYSHEDLDNLRFAGILHNDMGVNMEGIDIILQMRKSMFEMRKQFDRILEDIAGSLRDNFIRK